MAVAVDGFLLNFLVVLLCTVAIDPFNCSFRNGFFLNTYTNRPSAMIKQITTKNNNTYAVVSDILLLNIVINLYL